MTIASASRFESLASASRFESLAGRLTAIGKSAIATALVDVDAIAPNPHQSRTTFDDQKMEQLVETVRRHGVQTPVAVTLVSPGQYELVWGERRWRAAKTVGLKAIPAILKEELTDRDKLRLALIENMEREEMTPLDEARGVAKYVDMASVQEVADELRRPKVWVSKRVRIATAPDFVVAFAESGTVGDGEALYELAKLAGDQPGEAKRIITSYAPGSHLREQLKAAQRPTDAPSGEADDAGETTGEQEDENVGPRGDRRAAGAESRETDLARSGAGPRGGGERGDGEEEVSHAKLEAKVPPMRIEAVLHRKGEIVFVTADGKHRVEFTPKAKQQLADILAK